MQLTRPAVEFFLVTEELSEFTEMHQYMSDSVPPESLLAIYNTFQEGQLKDVGAQADEFLVTRASDFDVPAAAESFRKMRNFLYWLFHVEAFRAYVNGTVAELLALRGPEVTSSYCSGFPENQDVRFRVELVHADLTAQGLQEKVSALDLNLFPDVEWHLGSAKNALEKLLSLRLRGFRPADVSSGVSGGLSHDDIMNVPRGLACCVVESARDAMDKGLSGVEVPAECLGSVTYASGDLQTSLRESGGAQVLVRRTHIGRNLPQF